MRANFSLLKKNDPAKIQLFFRTLEKKERKKKDNRKI